jgi:hypothetical protein
MRSPAIVARRATSPRKYLQGPAIRAGHVEQSARGRDQAGIGRRRADGSDQARFFWGADTTSAAMMAIAAGITYVAGAAVAPDVPDPAGVSMLGLSDIFA